MKTIQFSNVRVQLLHCEQLTIADIGFFWIFDILSDIKPLDSVKWLAGFPTIEKHFKFVASNPKIKAFVDKRSKSAWTANINFFKHNSHWRNNFVKITFTCPA